MVHQYVASTICRRGTRCCQCVTTAFDDNVCVPEPLICGVGKKIGVKAKTGLRGRGRARKQAFVPSRGPTALQQWGAVAVDLLSQVLGQKTKPRCTQHRQRVEMHEIKKTSTVSTVSMSTGAFCAAFEPLFQQVLRQLDEAARPLLRRCSVRPRLGKRSAQEATTLSKKLKVAPTLNGDKYLAQTREILASRLGLKRSNTQVRFHESKDRSQSCRHPSHDSLTHVALFA